MLIRTHTLLGLAAAAVAVAACNRSSKTDAALGTDLTLAAQQQRTLDSISAIETAAARAPAPSALRSTPARTASAPRTSSGTTRSTSSSGTTTTTSNGTVITQKNTNRDAAIGAAAGAILGATTSHDKVKGGIIGAVVGGVVGGVVGNNVDVKKKKKGGGE